MMFLRWITKLQIFFWNVNEKRNVRFRRIDYTFGIIKNYAIYVDGFS